MTIKYVLWIIFYSTKLVVQIAFRRILMTALKVEDDTNCTVQARRTKMRKHLKTERGHNLADTNNPHSFPRKVIVKSVGSKLYIESVRQTFFFNLQY